MRENGELEGGWGNTALGISGIEGLNHFFYCDLQAALATKTTQKAEVSFANALELVIENIQDFEMDPSEARAEAKKEFAQKGLDCSSIDWSKIGEDAAAAVSKTDVDV